MSRHTNISPGQVLSLRKALAAVTGDGKAQLYIAGGLVGRKLESLFGISGEEWQKIRDSAYPNWQDNNWELSKDFRARLAKFNEEYIENEAGQRRMF